LAFFAGCAPKEPEAPKAVDGDDAGGAKVVETASPTAEHAKVVETASPTAEHAKVVEPGKPAAVSPDVARPAPAPSVKPQEPVAKKLGLKDFNPTEKIKKEKLQIVFLFGQSNMVGVADARTAWYLTQPQYVPPRDISIKKTRFFDWSLYWGGLRTFKGPEEMKRKLDDLYWERRNSRMKWRQRHRGLHGPWKTEEWGPKPKGGRSNMYPFLDRKAEEEGIHRRIAEILDSPLNEFPVEAAYEEIANRDKRNAYFIERVKGLYLKGATPEAFDAFNAAVAEAKINAKVTGEAAADTRARHAELAKKLLNLPIAERTYIKAHGHVAGVESKTANAGNQKNASGILSVGYGGGVTTIGPEYGVGITLERYVDAPILLVKCSWGNTNLSGAWRPPSLDGVETPVERAGREAGNKSEAELARKEGREPKPRPAPKPTGKLSYCWGMTLPEVDKVLADPGKYHPDYDPAVGFEVAGLVWFQGYSDMNNKAYGELLMGMIKYFREKVKTPDMPVVCGALGMPSYKHMTFSGAVNGGMVQASQAPGFKGKVDVVNTARYFPIELDLIGTVMKNTDKESEEYKTAAKYRSRAISNKGFHYHGSAKCFLLMGDAMGRSLANIMAGGEPFVEAELEALRE